MKVAIIHDWLVTYAGAERVLEQIINIFPEADLYSLVDFLEKNKRQFIKNKLVTTSFIQKLPLAKKIYRSYLPLMPLAIEQFDLSGYDLIISSSHCVAKGVLTGTNQKHICVCYTPIRYAWELQHQYLIESNMRAGVKSWLSRIILHYMRLWDLRTANGVDEYIAISHYIQKRIFKVYRRESVVIYPPVNTNDYGLNIKKEDFYLTASRLVPYKKIKLIVESFNKMSDKKLIVIGAGPDYEKIKKIANHNVELMGYQPFEILKEKMQKAQAFIFAAEEDFGITPIEAQSCGTPVIAYGKGGALETIKGLDKDSPTGVFFYQQSVQSIIAAVLEFENHIDKFNPIKCRENAKKFSEERFLKEFTAYIKTVIDD